MGIQEARKKIYRYCAYQERSHKEVRNKLYSFGLSSRDIDETIVSLITDGFLNEERFAKAFAGGKFRLKHWGRLKIVRELEAHDISRNCIAIGMKEIDSGDYEKALMALIEKKVKALSESNRFVLRDKVARFAISKGFEPDLVWTHLKRLIRE